MSSRYITDLNSPPRGRVFSCLQCNMFTQKYVCCGHSPWRSTPSSYLRRARTGGSGALGCRVAAFVSHFPPTAARQKLLRRPFTRRSAFSNVESSCVFAAVAWVLRGSWRGASGLHRTSGDISADDEEAADRRRAGAAAQRCRLLASPLEAGQAGGGVCTPCF